MIGAANYIMDNLIASGSAKEIIVVMPFGHAVPHGSPPEIQRTNTQKFEEYLLGDIIPLVESKYRVLRSQRDRAIAGLSMGGGQAISIGLQNLDKFCAIGSFSGAVPRNGDGSDRINEILTDAANVNQRLDLFWIGCGRDDSLLERNELFAKLLKENNIEHELQLTAGVHNYDVWRWYFATLAPKLFQATVPPPGAAGNADNLSFIGGRDPLGNPVRLAKKTGHVSNYDESKVPEYSLPNPLTMADGRDVTSASQWQARRAEILGFYQEQIYGRIPKNSPAVKWQVTETENNSRDGTPIAKTIEGTIGNQSDSKLRLTLLALGRLRYGRQR